MMSDILLVLVVAISGPANALIRAYVRRISRREEAEHRMRVMERIVHRADPGSTVYFSAGLLRTICKISPPRIQETRQQGGNRDQTRRGMGPR